MSNSLHEVEIRYLPLEKAILAVVHATRKLPYYFQAHIVVVLTQLPLQSVKCLANQKNRKERIRKQRKEKENRIGNC